MRMKNVPTKYKFAIAGTTLLASYSVTKTRADYEDIPPTAEELIILQERPFKEHIWETPIKSLRYLLQQNPELLSATNRHGDTMLIMACNHERIDVVKLLLELGVDVNVRNLDGRTALMQVVANLSYDNNGMGEVEEIVKLLLSDPKLDINTSNNHDRYAPMIAYIMQPVFPANYSIIEVNKRVRLLNLVLSLRDDINVKGIDLFSRELWGVYRPILNNYREKQITKEIEQTTKHLWDLITEAFELE